MPTTWRTSSRSSNGSNCVEVAFAGDDVVARDSKAPVGPVLTFGAPHWASFLAAVKQGNLDGAFTTS
jgi:hypothetical protein